MKSTIQSFRKTLIAILMSAIIFAACKKSDTGINPPPTEEATARISATDSTSVRSGVSSEQSIVLSTLEGFGSGTQGGAGQQVVRVTNLNSSGSGSLSNAMGSNRTIVFDVAGTINNFSYEGSGIHHLTIDGASAPSPGITLNNNGSGNGMSFDNGSNNIIVSNIRVRNAGNDGFNVVGNCHDIVFDHVSSSGNGDGCLDITDGCYNITVQWSIFGSSEAGPMLIAYPGTKNNTVHHNLFNSSASGAGERNPFVHNATDYQPNVTNDIMCDFTNNVVWNWKQFGSCADYGATLQARNNFYQSTQNPGNAIVKNRESTGAKIYASGNVSGNSGVNPNNVTNVSSPWSVAAVTTQSACSASAMVLAQVGPRPLDATDQALVSQVSLSNCPGGTTTNQAPVANAGTDKTITLPVSSVTLTGSASDPDGTIASYLWTKVSGTGGTITTTTAATTTITGLTAGTYIFSLKATDNAGATATDNVTVTVNPVATTNQPPVVNAGTDKTITLPVSSVTLTGTASDPDGTIASYLWTKVSGTGGTITTATAATTTITGLTAGTYVFSLKATDNGGATATDNVTVTVNAATPTNQPPVVNAGIDKTITLPASSLTLTGTATDADGTIASYLWTKVSGTGGAITTPTAASTTVTGLTAGTYVFSLKATDNAGATATDNVTVTVNAAATNQAPVVNAGPAQTITLPVSSVTLSGSATDADGTVVSYLWTKVSGTGGTITNPNSASTTVTGLSAGSYVFNLQATDNLNATGNKTITITVNPAAAGGGGYGTLSFSEGYDVSSSVNTNQGPRNSVSFTNYFTGPGSFRSEVRAGATGSNATRSEMGYTATAQNPTEGVVEYDVYYENWNSLDGGGHSIEWIPATSGAGALVSLQNYGGKFDVVRAIGSTVTHQPGTLMTCSSNTWYKLRWEFKWSTGSDGYVRLYINNVLYYSFTGKTADGSGQTLRVGQFRWPNSGSTMQVTSVSYYDNLKIYKK